MGRLIDANKTIEILKGMEQECEDNWERAVLEDAIRAIENQPTVDAEPVRHGHWIYDPDGMDWNIPAWKCSECRFVCGYLPTVLGKKQVVNAMLNRFAGSHFCPNCGVKMEAKV